MWDERIAGGYGLLRERTGLGYAFKFLPRVAAEMEEAIASYAAEHGSTRYDTVAALIKGGCGRSLPKLLDEFNYAKFTMSSDQLWRAT